MRAPDLTQRVIGYRQWKVKDNELWPVSTTSGGAWKPGPQHADCWVHYGGLRIPCLPVVDVNCDCGFYALHDLHQATLYGGYSGQFSVQGIVTGWGRLAVHEDGFRAEWIEVMAIICPDDCMERGEFPQMYRDVAKHYNIPCIQYSHAPGFAQEFGAEMPESLKPTLDEMHEFEVTQLPEHLSFQRVQACGAAKRHRTSYDRMEELLDISDEIDISVPEAMIGLKDIYVPNMGDLLVCVHEPPKPNYKKFVEESFRAPKIDPMMSDRFHISLSISGTIAYLTEESEEY